MRAVANAEFNEWLNGLRRASSTGSSTSRYENESGSSNTISNRSSNSNSNQNEWAKEHRRNLREKFRREGQPESWWNPHWYYENQVRRRKKRAENIVKYPSEKPLPLPKVPFRKLIQRELTGSLKPKFRVGNVAVQIHRAGGRREYMSLANFNGKYGNKWKRIGSASSRLIAPEINSNLQRRQIKVVKFVNRNT
jgi:hypothetical protein